MDWLRLAMSALGTQAHLISVPCNKSHFFASMSDLCHQMKALPAHLCFHLILYFTGITSQVTSCTLKLVSALDGEAI